MAPRRPKTSDDDPLTRAIAPPPNETPAQRELRIAAEQEAKRVSDAIDDELNRQRIADKKNPKPVKILLLGKSTTLKNFQLMHAPKAFHAEKASWRAVIQLNVVQSIHSILDLISKAHAASNVASSSSSTSSGRTSTASSAPSSPTGTASKEYPPLTPEHLKLKMRLAPLIHVEAALIRRLLPPDQIEGLARSNLTASPFHHEISVNSSTSWKGALGRLMRSPTGRDSRDSTDLVNWSDPDDPGVVLHACSEDMTKLWVDPTVRKLMEIEKMRPEEMAGLCSPKYVPTDDDILRARLKTLGVSEHRFQVKGHLGSTMSTDWRVFDVGGQRSAWAPYFDDMNAIIFLAPISCFDQVLQEDPTVNRLADSFLLWKSIVSNPLLKKTDIVLFLNKCDILRAKLQSGIRLGDYITSYGNRPNDYESASTYFRKKFAGLMKEHAGDRPFFSHFTSVTDTQSTSLILQNVQDIIIRHNLRKSALVG
ncbi:G-alpha-domain-containing protein [Boletus coccyginus]|nr:G-alpha-domain-containing protein [Boletus coccyginus]